MQQCHANATKLCVIVSAYHGDGISARHHNDVSAGDCSRTRGLQRSFDSVDEIQPSHSEAFIGVHLRLESWCGLQ